MLKRPVHGRSTQQNNTQYEIISNKPNKMFRIVVKHLFSKWTQEFDRQRSETSDEESLTNWVFGKC